jgi:hypothetical protein
MPNRETAAVRALTAALWKTGSILLLAAALEVTPEELQPWIRGDSVPPDRVYERAKVIAYGESGH